MRDPDQQYIPFATVSLEDEAQTIDIPYTKSIEEPGKVVPLANELNPALDKYYCYQLGKNDTPQRVKIIHEPIIRCDPFVFFL